MQEDNKAAFNVGQRVRVVNEPDKVGEIKRVNKPVQGKTWYNVTLSSGVSKRYPETSLEQFAVADLTPESLFEAGRFGRREGLIRLLTLAKLDKPLSDVLYSFMASRTDVYPYQFKPVLKFVESLKSRILIADEVGLGKTIEAGLIMLEAQIRQVPFGAVLIVCPATLRLKWRQEMRQRFDASFDVVAQREFLKAIRRSVAEPDESPPRLIVSIESIRSKGVIEAVQECGIEFSLVAVDEAHHLRNPETLSNRVISALADYSQAMVLLTATPIHLGYDDLFYLLRILDPEEFRSPDVFKLQMKANGIVNSLMAELGRNQVPDFRRCAKILGDAKSEIGGAYFSGNPYYELVLDKLTKRDPTIRRHVVEVQADVNRLNVLSHIMSRTRARDVRLDRPQRRSTVLSVNYTTDEMTFYNQITDLCRDWYVEQGRHLAAVLHAMTLQRQMASSIPAMIERYYTGTVDSIDEEFSESHEVVAEESGPEDAPRGPRLSETQAFRSLVARGHHLLDADSKFERFLEEVRRLLNEDAKAKLIVFTSFRSTLAYLLRRLQEDGIAAEFIHGDVAYNPDDPDQDERSRRIANFRDNSEIRILLSSEVGAEGLDLQFCNTIVNYDLPWNPMRIEQRIGRVDRLG